MIRVLISGLLCGVLPSCLPAAEFTVGPNLPLPWAVFYAGPGDTIYIPYAEEPYETFTYIVDHEDLEIIGVSSNGRQPRIKGHIEVRDSASIKIHNLEIFQEPPADMADVDQNDSSPSSFIREGITIRHSVDVEVRNCTVHDCGGGGITANHSDLLRIIDNDVFDNAKLNRDQHSGISVYQPIDHGIDDGRYWHIEISGNTSSWNQNVLRTTAGPDGIRTDGNGIILDDYFYAQRQHFPAGVDVPSEPYNGRTLVENNRCWKNGGRGIHCYIANNVYVKNNTSYQNQRSGMINELAEISVSDSTNVLVVNNIMSASQNKYAALTRRNSDVHWTSNILFSRTPPANGLVDYVNGFNNTLNLVDVDPLIRHRAHTLRPGSPAIDAGDTWEGHDELRSDIYGNNRLQGADVDIGAVEF